jgi:cysteine desulfurase
MMASCRSAPLQSIYLDHHATTPPLPEVLEALRACPWGNPSSLHGFGQEARRALDRAREQVAALLGADPEEIVFTSGGTEADNLALRGTSGPIVTSAIEHSAVLETCQVLETRGVTVLRLPVDPQGRVDPQADLPPDLALLSLQLANQDLGTIQPVAALAARAHALGALVHTDAVQAVGKIPVDVREMGVDLLSVSAHKLYGPKGVGALFIRRGLGLTPLLTGGPQERRLRAGTENLPGIVGFGVACRVARERLETRAAHVRRLRDRLQAGILEGIPGTRLNGAPEPRLPGALNVGFAGIPGEDLLLNLDLEDIAVSLGAACHSQSRRASPVLLALGQGEDEARSALRFTLGEGNTVSEIDRTLEVLAVLVARLRR